MANKIRNWKTTLAGIACLALSAVFFGIGQPVAGGALVPIGIGFINAKDDNK